MFGLREYSHEEYIEDLKKELKAMGLHDSVQKRCDEINEECRNMGYATHRYIQELMCEILDLIEENEKDE